MSAYTHTHPLRSKGSDSFTPDELEHLVSTEFEPGRTYYVESWGSLQPLRFSPVNGTGWCVMRQHNGEVDVDTGAAVYPDAYFPWKVMPFAKARVRFVAFPHPIVVDINPEDMRKWSCNTHTQNGICFLLDRNNVPFIRLSTVYLEEITEIRERQRSSLDWIIRQRPSYHRLYTRDAVAYSTTH